MWTPKSTTKDGFELQFGTNHLGHFAFTGLLLNRCCVSRSRVVTVSSQARFGRSNPLRRSSVGTRIHRIAAYGQSKLANLLFTYELQRRLRTTNTAAVAAHPGGSNTELARNVPPMQRVAMAALAPLT